MWSFGEKLQRPRSGGYARVLRNERSKKNAEISFQIRKWSSAYFLRFDISFQSFLNLKKGAFAPFFNVISYQFLTQQFFQVNRFEKDVN